MKDETGGVAIEGFVGLKPKVHLFLVDDSSDYKETKGVNMQLRHKPWQIKKYFVENQMFEAFIE